MFGSQVSAQEWAARVDLAACCRLVAHLGWDDLFTLQRACEVPSYKT